MLDILAGVTAAIVLHWTPAPKLPDGRLQLASITLTGGGKSNTGGAPPPPPPPPAVGEFKFNAAANSALTSFFR